MPGVLESLEASHKWMMVALACHEDMTELLDAAKKGCGLDQET